MTTARAAIDDDHPENRQDVPDLAGQTAGDDGDPGGRIEVEGRRIEPDVLPFVRLRGQEAALAEEGLLDHLLDVGEPDVGAQPLRQGTVGVIDKDEVVEFLFKADLLVLDLNGALELGHPRPQGLIEVLVQIPGQQVIGHPAEGGQQQRQGEEVQGIQAKPDGLEDTELDAIKDAHVARRR